MERKQNLTRSSAKTAVPPCRYQHLRHLRYTHLRLQRLPRRRLPRYMHNPFHPQRNPIRGKTIIVKKIQVAGCRHCHYSCDNYCFSGNTQRGLQSGCPQTPVPTAYQQSTPYYTPTKTVYTTTAPTVTQVSGGPLSTAEYNPSSRAQFRANRTAGPAPLTVSFYDLTLGGPVKWVWDFGDTSGSSERNPVHIYKKAGKYTVTMNTVISGTMYSNSMNITVTGS